MDRASSIWRKILMGIAGLSGVEFPRESVLNA